MWVNIIMGSSKIHSSQAYNRSKYTSPWQQGGPTPDNKKINYQIPLWMPSYYYKNSRRKSKWKHSQSARVASLMVGLGADNWNCLRPILGCNDSCGPWSKGCSGAIQGSWQLPDWEDRFQTGGNDWSVETWGMLVVIGMGGACSSRVYAWMV